MHNSFWGLNGILMGALSALVLSALVLGGFMLAFSENVPDLVVQPTAPPAISQLTPAPSDAASPTLTILPSATATLTPAPSRTTTPSATTFPSPTGCPIPPGWIPYTVQRGETLNPLAARFGLHPQELADANCISRSQQVVPGLILYIPGPTAPPPYASPIPCTPKYNWVVYIVQPGDTLYNLAARVNSTPYELQLANCLPSNYIYVGQRLYVPFYPAPLPTSPWPTPIPTTPIPTDTAIPTDTEIPTEQPPTEPPPPTDDNSSGSTPPAPSPP